MLIAEELLVAALDPAGRNLLGASRGAVLAGAYLAELALLERLAVDDQDLLQVLDDGSTGDPLLDDALVRLAAHAGAKPETVLDAVGRALLQPTLDSLVRREMVRPEPVKVLGVRMGSRWPSVDAGQRSRLITDLAGVVTGGREPGSRTTAMTLVALLHAGQALARVVPKDQRPGISDRELRRRAEELLAKRWASQSVTRAVVQASAATSAAVAAGGEDGGGGGGGE